RRLRRRDRALALALRPGATRQRPGGKPCQLPDPVQARCRLSRVQEGVRPTAIPCPVWPADYPPPGTATPWHGPCRDLLHVLAIAPAPKTRAWREVRERVTRSANRDGAPWTRSPSSTRCTTSFSVTRSPTSSPRARSSAVHARGRRFPSSRSAPR